MNLTIKEMDVADFDAISPILQNEFDPFWTPTLLQSEIEKEDTLCLVAKMEGTIVRLPLSLVFD